MAYEATEVALLLTGWEAEIDGVDLKALNNRQWDEVQPAFAENGVVYFRDQQHMLDERIAFARRWTAIETNKSFPAIADDPEIAEVRTEPEQKKNIGNLWDTDHGYRDKPAMASILLAGEVPEEAGDTLFADMYLTFETLSEGMKWILRGLRAIHLSVDVFGPRNACSAAVFKGPELVGDVVYPVVIWHPLTGSDALYVNAGFTERFKEWRAEDRITRLEQPYRHSVRPESVGARTRSRSGTTAPPGTMRPTIIKGCAA